MAANAVHLTKPLSVDEISRIAGDFDYNNDIPFLRWMRAADIILKQAHSYHRDGNDEQAYIFFLRHAILLLEKLPTHPQAKAPLNKKALADATRSVQTALKILEELKPRIARRHDEYAKVQQRKLAERKQIEDERQFGALEQDAAGDWDDWSQYQPAGSLRGQKRTLEAKEHGDLALQLAHSERRKRRLERGIDQYDGSRRRRSGDGRTRQQQQHPHQDESFNLSKSIVDAGKKSPQTLLERRHEANGSSVTAAPPQYPSVPHRSDYEAPKPSMPDWGRDVSRKDSMPSVPPLLPPKERERSQTPTPPPIPSKIAEASSDSSPPSRSLTATPNVNSQNFTFKPAAFTEDGTPLRTVFLPEQLRARFLSLAAHNTALNREFLGILCGTLISNAFFINKLVLPEQEATSDTCEMVEEGEVSLWEYCDTADLMTLGWIHTHPTQTCFMSSRDLHTHSGYQAQMAESVAIVCAPKHHPSWGAFRLTDPPGLKHVLKCRQIGIFHPHTETNLYTDAMKPGHVTELPNLPFEVVDLRK